MLDKIKDCINKKDIDNLLILLQDVETNNEILELLNNFYNKEIDICNTVLTLNTIKNEKGMKKRSKESGYFEYSY